MINSLTGHTAQKAGWAPDTLPKPGYSLSWDQPSLGFLLFILLSTSRTACLLPCTNTLEDQLVLKEDFG